MDVDIDASIPKLKQYGRLHALRRISKVGTVTYHAITFQGDNSIKHQVIARYLDAERQAQADHNLAVMPTNYKFKFKGERTSTAADARVYVFEVTPRHKRVGLFKGELWLDTHSYLPVYEKGRLVKNASIFFKKVEFERSYAVQSGVSVPVRTASTIKTRLVGNVELNINYSHFALTADQAAADDEPAPENFGSQVAAQVTSGPYAP
jgi:hypothetical protein